MNVRLNESSVFPCAENVVSACRYAIRYALCVFGKKIIFLISLVSVQENMLKYLSGVITLGKG